MLPRPISIKEQVLRLRGEPNICNLATVCSCFTLRESLDNSQGTVENHRYLLTGRRIICTEAAIHTAECDSVLYRPNNNFLIPEVGQDIWERCHAGI